MTLLPHRRLPAPRSWAALIAAIAVGLTLAACAGGSPEPSAEPASNADAIDPSQARPIAETTPLTDTTGVTHTTGVTTTTVVTGTDVAGLANPASVFCVESGGTLEIRTDATGGQVGICVFSDGSECEEWAFYRGECAPGQGGAPAQVVGPHFASDVYGFTLDAPKGWRIDEAEANHVILRKEVYFLFVGFKRADDEIEAFRTGMPAGDFVDGGTAVLLGQDLPKRLLVFDGNTKVVEYSPGVGVGDLLLHAWLDGDPPPEDYMDMDIPDDVIAEGDAIIASFALTSGETPELVLPPRAAP